jgi:hypothetical protein
MEDGLVKAFDGVLGALARVFAGDGDTLGVALLALAKAKIEQTDFDNWDGGQYGYSVYLEVPENLYRQLLAVKDEDRDYAKLIAHRLNQLTPQFRNERIDSVSITVELVDDPNWRDKAKAYVSGQGISNQGRARSDNLAPRMCDGLLFRSQPEIHLYKALKSAGVTFAPLPVFIRGGDTYRRIEPDFVVLKNGLVLIVEVDGDTVHRETPLDAHNRTTMMGREGAVIERVNASECETPEKARLCAAKIMDLIVKHKANK